MTIMADGVVSTTASPPLLQLLTLEETLSANPSGVQDLWFARLYLLKPLIVLVLSLFWIASGLIALLGLNAAATYLAASFGEAGATLLTVFTSLADILFGSLVLFRRHAAKAMIGMLVFSVLYLIDGTMLAPSLWLDPLGPYVKVIPSLFLTLVGLAIFNER
jgi:hypothetical protein